MSRDDAAPRAPAQELSPDSVVAELESSLARASELLHLLRDRTPEPLPGHDGSRADQQVESLRRRLEAAENDLHEVSERLVDTEHQRGRLMNLYVATYQLHATLNIDDVKMTIAEIARDLLGAERFALLLRDQEGDGCDVALAEGLPADDPSPFANGRYEGGDAAIDRTLAEGVLLTEPEGSTSALAVVPLKVQGVVVGAVVLLKLYDHKPALTADDRDLLDLLAAHAASALLAARVYSATDRKLKTLESLVRLVRS